jgi:DNA polymerase-1
MNHVYLIDGHALLHRAWHAIPVLTTKDGLVVHALYGFMMAIEKIRAEEPLTHLAVCWDMEGGTFRDELFSDYKATREKKEDELYAQIPLIQELLDAYGIPWFGVEGFEADDVLGTLAHLITKEDETAKVTIVTGDMDSLQLVTDQVEVLAFVKGISQTKRYTPQDVEERWGVRPDQVVDYKALRGDASDNIPGVKGIGEKTAGELLKRFGTLEKALSGAEGDHEGMSAAVAKKLLMGVEQARLSQTLARIRTDAPVVWSMKAARAPKETPVAVVELYQRYEFRSLVARVQKRQGTLALPKAVEQAVQEGALRRLVTIDTDGAGLTAAVEMLTQAKRMALQVWGDATKVQAIAMADGKDAMVFLEPNAHVCRELVQAWGEQAWVAYDRKAILHTLSGAVPSIATTLFARAKGMDILVANYLLSPSGRGGAPSDVLAQWLGTGLPSWPDTCATNDDAQRAGLCTASLLSAADAIQSELVVQGMGELYAELEHPLIRVLFMMEQVGVALDVKTLAVQGKALTKKKNDLEALLMQQAGETFNPNSPAQLAHVLFDVLQLPTKGIKRTAASYSTAAPELEKLKGAHPIIATIGEYRECAKLLSTYIEALPQLVDAHGRVHSSFHQTIAATGRLSSSDPNLQNIPIRTPEGRLIREAFVAEDGFVFVGADYSQIELRLAAAFSGDETMKRFFTEGGDIHRATAAAVFGVAEEEVTKEQRRAAKAVNFGMIYGIGPRALGRDLGVPTAQASAFMEKYFAVFPRMRAYLDELIVEARRVGYAKTVFGRRRPLPDLASGMPMLRAAAERMAMNMPLQGAAADLMKRAMLRFASMVEEHGWAKQVRMVLQVHDELIIEVKKGLEEAVSVAVRDAMEGAADLGIPCTVEVSVGEQWGALK